MMKPYYILCGTHCKHLHEKLVSCEHLIGNWILLTKKCHMHGLFGSAGFVILKSVPSQRLLGGLQYLGEDCTNLIVRGSIENSL